MEFSLEKQFPGFTYHGELHAKLLFLLTEFCYGRSRIRGVSVLIQKLFERDRKLSCQQVVLDS